MFWIAQNLGPKTQRLCWPANIGKPLSRKFLNWTQKGAFQPKLFFVFCNIGWASGGWQQRAELKVKPVTKRKSLGRGPVAAGSSFLRKQRPALWFPDFYTNNCVGNTNPLQNGEHFQKKLTLANAMEALYVSFPQNEPQKQLRKRLRRPQTNQ